MMILKAKDTYEISCGVSCMLVNLKIESLFAVYPFGLVFTENNNVLDNFSDIKGNPNSIKLTKINSKNNSIFIDLSNIKEEVRRISLFINIFSLESDLLNDYNKIEKTELKISLCNDAELLDELRLLPGNYDKKFNTYKLLDIYKKEGIWFISHNFNGLNTYHLELLNKLLR